MGIKERQARTAALKAAGLIPVLMAQATAAPAPKAARVRKPLPVIDCRHGGTDADIIERCTNCNGAGKHVRECDVHERCTWEPVNPGVMNCRKCRTEGLGYEPVAPPVRKVQISGLSPTERETIVGEGPLCVVTLNVGNVMGVAARASQLAAARRWGAAYAEILAPLTNVGGKVHWQKAFLAEWARAKGYTRVAYYDSDIVIRSDCPSVFEQVPTGSLGIVSNQQKDFAELSNRHHARYDSDRQWWAARLGGKVAPAERHVNGGLIVFEPATHADLFKQWADAGASIWYARADVLVDEAALSTVLENSDVPRVWLPATFNLLFYRSPALNHSPVMAAYAYHGAGRAPKHKLERLRWDLAAVEAPFTWRSIKEEKMFDFGALYDAQVARVEGPAAFVELGCWRGKSSCFMAEAIKASGKPIRFYCIDIWTGTPHHKWMRDTAARAGGDMLGLWRDNLQRAGVLDFATPIQEDSARAARHFADGSVDFVFVDADHRFENVVADVRAWRPKLVAGGVMAGHDFDMPDVARAVRQEFGPDGFAVTGRTWIAEPTSAPVGATGSAGGR
jgi:cephalosporin hydroxylase